MKCQADKNKTQYTRGMTGCKFPEPQNGIWQPSEADRSLSGLHARSCVLVPCALRSSELLGPLGLVTDPVEKHRKVKEARELAKSAKP